MSANEGVLQKKDAPLAQVPVLDFESHPAFSRKGNELPRDREAEKILQDIEAASAEITLRPWSSRDELKTRFDASVRPAFSALADLAAGHPALSPEFREYTRGAIDKAAGFLLENLQSAPGTPDAGTHPPTGNATTDSLLRDGFCRMDFGAALAQRMWRSVWWERGVLRRRARTYPGRHCVISLHNYSPASLAVQHALEEHGILEAASIYLGRPMQFLYAALDHAHPEQNWYQDCYADAGLPTSETAYLHFDADSDVLKAMLYLRDVQQENGPFRFVRGSHAWKRSAPQCALNKGFDVQDLQVFERDEHDLDYKLGYYRPRYRVAEYRNALMLLPRILRGSTHFGDDILDGTPLSRALLDQEVTFAAPAGTFVLFDGSRGIHRGSQAERGERWAVQIAMRAGPPPPRLALRKVLRRKLNYQLMRARRLLQRKDAG